DLVAETIYIAATDNIKQWRYLVASEEFINYRKSMTDQEWIASMMKNYLGKD
ncbi:short-chain dehydrogenase, partial [Streptococcus anginosus]|nr:short-chain dehydrogenase [Streptococcus anginosus]